MGTLREPTEQEEFGTYDGVTYVQYRGRFVGQTSQGRYRVPYEITEPRESDPANQRIIVEPPHFDSGLVARDGYLGPEFLFDRGISHASVGYSFFRKRILLDLDEHKIEPMIGGKEPHECPDDNPEACTDYEIIAEFARALRQIPWHEGYRTVYSIGMSDSGDAIRLVLEAAYGQNLFDLSFPITVSAPIYPSPGTGRVIVFNSEFDYRPVSTDTQESTRPQSVLYRYYAVAGAPHIPDTRLSRQAFPDPPPLGSPLPSVAGTSPIDWIPFFKALFVAGDQWVTEDKEPPPSAVLELTPEGFIARDERCNARGGIRHPALQLGEATFIASVVRGRSIGWRFFGGYGGRLGLVYPDYVDDFTRAARALYRAGFLLKDDRDDLINKSQLRPDNTYTLSYLAELFNLSSEQTSLEQTGVESSINEKSDEFGEEKRKED